MSTTVLLCLGSNMVDVASANIDKAIESIEANIGRITASSGKYDTPSYHNGKAVPGARYLNEVVTIEASLGAAAIDAICKEIEASLGRNEETRRIGAVPIDVDVVAYDGEIIRPVDFNSPYFIKGYKKIMETNISALADAWGVKPDASCDLKLWQEQYAKNPDLWNRLFEYLVKTDLSTLSPGKVELVPDRLWINVMTYNPKDFDSTPAEAHKKYIDLQYTISGNEVMGIVRDGNVIVTDPYSESADVEKYLPTGAVQFTKATPDRFFLYFPGDIHQPSVSSTSSPTPSHKIVAKIEYRS